MASRSRRHDMIIIINKKKCKKANQNRVTLLKLKLSFLNSSLKKINLQILGFFLLANFTALSYENRETMGAKFIN